MRKFSPVEMDFGQLEIILFKIFTKKIFNFLMRFFGKFHFKIQKAAIFDGFL